jgi:hypothetical protein
MLLALILAFLGFLLSPLGMFQFLLGLLLFLLLPIVSLLTGDKRFSHVHFWLGMWAIGRGAPTLSEHGDLLWKQMSFDDIGVETISFGGERKEFTDPDGALHQWMGFPFALAEEAHGFLFDPRHAAIGQRKHEHDQEGTGTIQVTREEWDEYQVRGWKPGVFELPKGVHELVDLSMARQLVDGSERSDDPQRVEKWYQYAVAPDGNRQSILRLMTPVIAFLATFAGIWLIWDQSSGGASAGPTITGTLFLLSGLNGLRDGSGGDDVGTDGTGGGRDIDWRRTLSTIAIIGLPIAWMVVWFLLFGLVSTIFAGVALSMGFLFLPLLTLLARPSDVLTGGLSRYVFMKLGLFGYDQPVFKWTPRRYELEEVDDLEWTDQVSWYSMLGHTVGFTYDPSPDSFPAEHITTDELAARQERVTGETGNPVYGDGGQIITDQPAEDRTVTGTDTNIPQGYTRWTNKRRGLFGGYIPRESRLDDDNLYIRTGIATSRLIGGVTGESTERRLHWAREKYGDGNWGLSDSALLWATMGAIVLGVAFGGWIFFL